MKLFVADPYKRTNFTPLLRRAGYHPERNREGVISYARSLSGSQFPRFHVYIEPAEGGWSVNMHLDQKKPSYEGSSAHAGEYDGPIIEAEGRRLKGFLV